MKPLSYYCNISPQLEEQVTALSPHDKQMILALLSSVNYIDTIWSKEFSDLMNHLASLTEHDKLGLIIGIAYQLQPEL